MAPRNGTVKRTTRETDIAVELVVDGSGRAEVATGIPFFDHMLTLLARHGMLDLKVTCRGDVDVDYHHTVEDVGLAFGEALRQALGDKAGLRRYGCFLLPMDECLVRVALDLGGRAWLGWRVELAQPYVRDLNVQVFREFFRSVTAAAGMNLHVVLEVGDEAHHAIEAVFKGFARALDQAVQVDPRLGGAVPSTKGSL